MKHTSKILQELLDSIPLESKIKTHIEFAMIDMLTEAGYRQNESWREEEQPQLNALCKAAKLCSERIMKEITEWN